MLLLSLINLKFDQAFQPLFIIILIILKDLKNPKAIIL